MWTKNENGEPFCWVHPSHKPDARDPMNKEARSVIAHEVFNWFAGAIGYLAADQWQFAVNKKGVYLPGTPTGAKPADFAYSQGAWTLTLRVLSRVERTPHRQLELTNAREELHKVVTILLMNLIGSAPAGKWLATIRKEHGLPKLRKADIWGVQKLLF